MLKLVMLALLLTAQIGGYFKVSQTPDRIWATSSFDVHVELEMAAKEDTTLDLSGDLLKPSTPKLTIPKGQRKASFTVTAASLDPLAPIQTGTLRVSSNKKTETRQVAIYPLPPNWTPGMRMP